MSSLDDDEALFQDIYGDDSDSENKGKETKVESDPAAKDGEPAKSEPAEDNNAASINSSNEKMTTEYSDENAKDSAGNDQSANPQQQQVPEAQNTEVQFQTQHNVELPGLTSVAIGRQLQEKSEYFNRDQGKMFIGGLNWDTTEEKLKDYFSKYGEVIDFTIMRDNATGRSRGFGFLTFRTSSSVDEVLKTQHILDGKVIDPKRAIPKEEQDKTGKIFVGGIAPEVTEQEFDEFFSKFGNVIDAQLMIDKDTGRSRGFGFVTFDSPAAVDKVTQNKYLLLKGRQMEIKRAEPRGQQQQRTGGIRGYNANTALQLQQQHMGQGAYQYGGYGGQAPGASPGAGGVPGAAAPAAAAGYNPQLLQQYWQYWLQMQQMQGGQANPAQIAAMMAQQQQQQQDQYMGGGVGSGAGSPHGGNTPGSQQHSPSNDYSQLPSEKPLRLHSSNETGSNDDVSNSGSAGSSGEPRRQFNFPKGPRGGRGNFNRGRGGYGKNGGYHPYNR